jgi:hypothetical protein
MTSDELHELHELPAQRTKDWLLERRRTVLHRALLVALRD